MISSPDQAHQNLIRHLNTAGCEQQIAVVTDDASVRRICDLAISKGFSIQCYSDTNIGDESIIIIFSLSKDREWDFYTQLEKKYKAGKVVVFGGPGRGLFYESPSWKSIDLTIAGMFSLARDYVHFLKLTSGESLNYVEFGVFDGRTVSLAWHALKNVCDRFIAVDSFEGIQGSKLDINVYPDGSYFCNSDSFQFNLKTSGVDSSRVDAIATDITSPKNSSAILGARKIGICHIDTDTYEAALAALNMVRPNLANGALILFDEYHMHGADPMRGERRALQEWLNANPEIEVEKYRDYTAMARSFIFRTAK